MREVTAVAGHSKAQNQTMPNLTSFVIEKPLCLHVAEAEKMASLEACHAPDSPRLSATFSLYESSRRLKLRL